MRILSVNHEFENGTPARVHRPSGTILLAPSFFKKNDIEQEFILNHEIGHYVLQTKNEQLADKYAADKMMSKYGKQKTFKALNNSLFDTRTSDKRRLAMYNYMAAIDNLKNNNNMEILSSEQVYDNYTDSMIDVCFEPFADANGFVYTNDYVCDNDYADIQELEATDYVNWCRFYGKDFSDASAKAEERKAKKAQRDANRQAKTEARLARQEARTNILNSRANKNNAKAEGIANGTYQGVGGALKEGLNKAGEFVKGIFNKGGDAGDAAVYAEPQQEKSKLPLILGVVAGVVVIAVVVIILVKKRKK